MRSSLAAAFLLLCAVSASAGTITSISPSMIKVNSGEHFLTINGTDLGSLVIFDGPAGYFEMPANAVFSTSTHAWVPEAVVRKSGYYNVWVRNGRVDSNVVVFEVQGFKVFPLVILLPEWLIVQPRTREGAYVKFEPIALGGEDPDPVIRCDHESGSLFPMGTTKVTCTASNIYGESATDSFNISVFDRLGPTISVPEPIQVKWTSEEGAVVEYKISAYDDIWGEVIPECLPRSGSTFPVGITTVQCSAIDYDENVGWNSFTVEVIGELEPYPLTVVVPSDGINTVAVDPSGAPVKYEVWVEGSEDPYPEVTCTPESGSMFPIGTTHVLCEAIDRYGMRGSAGFQVLVADPDAPIIEYVAASPSLLPYDRRLYRIGVELSAYDKIDLSPYCEVADVTSIENIHLGDESDPKSYDWKITGQFTLELRGDRDTAVPRVYDVWVTCTDYFGNQSRTSVAVTVEGEKASMIVPSKRRAAGRK